MIPGVIPGGLRMPRGSEGLVQGKKTCPSVEKMTKSDRDEALLCSRYRYLVVSDRKKLSMVSSKAPAARPCCSPSNSPFAMTTEVTGNAPTAP